MIPTMQTLIILGCINLILITGTVSSTDETVVNKKTSLCTTPIAYNVSLEIENTRLKVVSNVVLNVSCRQQYLRFYIGRYCDIKNITVQPDVPYNFPAYWEPVYQNSIKNQFKRVDIRLFKGFQNDRRRISGLYGLYTICPIYYCSLEKVATVSTYISQTGKKEVFILPRFPAEWIFPYWENPAIKARFTIRIIHEHTKTVVSNMPIIEVYESKMVLTSFNTTPPISTHLIAVAVVPSVFVNYTWLDKGVTGSRLYDAQSLIQNITSFIKIMLDEIIPQPRHVMYMVVPVNFNYYKSIVTSGLVLFSDADIIYNTEIDSIEKKKEIICLVARSVIQEIFSNWLVTLRQSDVWFIEGFSTIYGVYSHDQVISDVDVFTKYK